MIDPDKSDGNGWLVSAKWLDASRGRFDMREGGGNLLFIGFFQGEQG